MKHKNKGQTVIEIIWVIFFIVGFLFSSIFFYKKSEEEVQKLRIGESHSYEKYQPSFY